MGFTKEEMRFVRTIAKENYLECDVEGSDVLNLIRKRDDLHVNLYKSKSGINYFYEFDSSREGDIPAGSGKSPHFSEKEDFPKLKELIKTAVPKLREGKEMIIDKIDNYLNEMDDGGDDSTIQPAEFSSLVTGIKRIQYRFNKATTPKKYADCFELVNKLVGKFPLKSKIIWGAVADAYTVRFGESMETEEIGGIGAYPAGFTGPNK